MHRVWRRVVARRGLCQRFASDNWDAEESYDETEYEGREPEDVDGNISRRWSKGLDCCVSVKDYWQEEWISHL